MNNLAHARKAGLVLAATLISSVALSSGSFAAVRAHNAQPRDQSGPFNPRVPQEGPGSSIDSIYQAPFYGNG